MQAIRDLATQIAQHAPGDGMHRSPIPGVWLIRSGQTTEPLRVVHTPAVCIIAQGAKLVSLGGTDYRYDTAKFLVVSVDLPVTGCVTLATEDEPYLCLRIDLDAQLLATLDLELPARPAARGTPPARGLFLSETTPALLDVASRLVRLLDAPHDIAVLAPLLLKEFHYRLLTGEQADTVRHCARGDGRMAQVTRAICWIKSENWRNRAWGICFTVSKSSRTRRRNPTRRFSPVMAPAQIRR